MRQEFLLLGLCITIAGLDAWAEEQGPSLPKPAQPAQVNPTLPVTAPVAEPSPDQQPMAEDPNSSKSAMDTLAETAQTTRDPFKPPKVEKRSLSPKSDLESFSVDQFKVSAIIYADQTRRAMILAPNGKTYFVGESAKIGQRKGVITRITPFSVVVREKNLDVFGKEQNADFEIKLPEEKRKR